MNRWDGQSVVDWSESERVREDPSDKMKELRIRDLRGHAKPAK